MGRRAEPIEKQRAKARGDGRTPGHREIVKAQHVIVVSTDRPVMPENLGDRGEVEWHKIWDSGVWLNPQQDYAWVEQIVRAYDDIDVFRRQVDKEGLVQKGSLGQPVAHPLLAEIRKCEATIRQCLSIMGFSPSDRARLGLAEIKRQSGLQELQNRTKEA